MVFKKQGKSLLSEDSFNDLIEYECNRTNISNIEFSLIVINLNEFSMNKPLFKKFINFLLRQIRSIDIAGYYKRDAIGIILPSTKYKEASNFLQFKNQGFTDFKSVYLSFYVYTYPDNWID